jgi:hypothetical protein
MRRRSSNPSTRIPPAVANATLAVPANQSASLTLRASGTVGDRNLSYKIQSTFGQDGVGVIEDAFAEYALDRKSVV